MEHHYKKYINRKYLKCFNVKNKINFTLLQEASQATLKPTKISHLPQLDTNVQMSKLFKAFLSIHFKWLSEKIFSIFLFFNPNFINHPSIFNDVTSNLF